MTIRFSPLVITGLLLLITSSLVKSQDNLVISQAPQIVTDTDGNQYHTVRIGKQVWMVENLKTTRFNDGKAIPLVSENQEWAHLTTSAYCWYNNDSVTNKNKYGALYNYYSVSTGKLAPKGWRVPTDEDWKILVDFLGGESVAGGKMKEEGTIHWKNPNKNASDSSGFSGLPGGFRLPEGRFFLLGQTGYWWASWTNNKSNFAVGRIMVSYNASAQICYESKGYGFSVRCIKDY
jgi:uncharacterized protein (TIGR02145 family)